MGRDRKEYRFDIFEIHINIYINYMVNSEYLYNTIILVLSFIYDVMLNGMTEVVYS